MPFLTDLGEFLRTAPGDAERTLVAVAGKILSAGTTAAGHVVEAGRRLEGAHRLPPGSLLSAVLASGTWRGGLAPRDAEGLSLSRDLLVAQGDFPVPRARPGRGEEPEAMGAPLAELARVARRQLVSSTLRVLVASSARLTPGALGAAIEDQINRTPRIFREGDLVFRLLTLAR